jgi:hypothetical protein
MRNLIQLFVFLCFSIAAVASNPVQNLTPLNSPIVVGQEVYFQYTGEAQCSSTPEEPVIILSLDGNITNPFFVLPVNATGFLNYSVGPIVFNTPGMANITYGIFGNCTFVPDMNPSSLLANIMPDRAIPTLSQWGLILIALSLMIFGIISLKSRQKQPKFEN